MTAIDAVLGAIRASASAQASTCRSAASSGCSPISVRRTGACRRSSTSPGPTARARPSPSCAPRSKRRASASTSTPRPIWCASTSASASPATLVDDERLGDALGALRGGQRRPVDLGVRDHHRRGVCLVQRDARRLSVARSRARRPLRRHQRDRAAGGDGDHAGVDRPPRIPRRDGREDRLREGGHPAPRRAGDRRRAGRARAARHRTRGADASARRASSPGAISSSAPSTAASSSRTATGCSTCRCRGWPAAISSATPRRRSATLRAIEPGFCRLARSSAGSPRPTGRRGCKRCAAGRWSRWRRRRPRSGSTAPTTKRAGARSPRRWPISKITRRGRWR